MRSISAFILFAALGMSGSATAMPGGTLIITDHAMDPKAGTFEKDLKKASKSTLAKDGDNGWHLYFIAYLKKAAGAEEVNVVFYDITGGKREQVNAFPINTQASAKILMSDVQLSPEQNFKIDHKYDVLITRLIGGKEDVYARAKVELK